MHFHRKQNGHWFLNWLYQPQKLLSTTHARPLNTRLKSAHILVVAMINLMSAAYPVHRHKTRTIFLQRPGVDFFSELIKLYAVPYVDGWENRLLASARKQYHGITFHEFISENCQWPECFYLVHRHIVLNNKILIRVADEAERTSSCERVIIPRNCTTVINIWYQDYGHHGKKAIVFVRTRNLNSATPQMHWRKLIQ